MIDSSKQKARTDRLAWIDIGSQADRQVVRSQSERAPDVASPPDRDWKTCAGTGTPDASTKVVTTHTYDALADRCSTAISGTATSDVSTRYTYDAAGNTATMVDGRGNTTTYGYDGAGRMTSLTDALGKTLSWTYDGLGNPTRQDNRSLPIPLTGSVTWTYDAAARMATRAANGVTVTYTYDDAGNQLTASDGTFTITSTYDRLNRVLTVDDEDAGTTPDTSYTYSLTAPSWTDPTGTYLVTLDRFDRPTSVDDPVNAPPSAGPTGPTAGRRPSASPTATPRPTPTTGSAARPAARPWPARPTA